MKQAPISFRIPAELRDRFDRVCQEYAINKSQLIRKWIEDFTNEKEGEMGFVLFEDELKDLEGRTGRLSTAELQEQNNTLWCELRDHLVQMTTDGDSTGEDIEGFVSGEWEVHFEFTESELLITAGRDSQHCNNQNPWAKVNYKDMIEMYGVSEINWLIEITS